MTAANISAANDEMAALFIAAWVTTAGYPAEFPNMDFDAPGIDTTWARWSVDYATGNQRTFGNIGGRRFGKTGVITIDIFTPLGKGLKLATDAAAIAISAYEGRQTPSDVWFRNVRIADGGASANPKGWWQTVVLADFDYDTLV